MYSPCHNSREAVTFKGNTLLAGSRVDREGRFG